MVRILGFILCTLLLSNTSWSNQSTKNSCNINLVKLYQDWSCNNDLSSSGCLTKVSIVGAGVAAAGAGKFLYRQYKAGKDLDLALSNRNTLRAKLVQEHDGVLKEMTQISNQLNDMTKHAGKLSGTENKQDVFWNLYRENYKAAKLKHPLSKDENYLRVLVDALDDKIKSATSKVETVKDPKVKKSIQNQIFDEIEKRKNYMRRLESVSTKIDREISSDVFEASVRRLPGHIELQSTEHFVKMDQLFNQFNEKRELSKSLSKEIDNLDAVTRVPKPWSLKNSTQAASRALKWTLSVGGITLLAQEAAFFLIGEKIAKDHNCTDERLDHPYMCLADKFCSAYYTCDKVLNFMSLNYERQKEILNSDSEMCEYYKKLEEKLQPPIRSLEYSCANKVVTVNFGIEDSHQKYTRNFSIPEKIESFDSVTVFDEKMAWLDKFEFDKEGRLKQVLTQSDAGVQVAGPELFAKPSPVGEEGRGNTYKFRDLYISKKFIPLASQCCDPKASANQQTDACLDLNNMVASFKPNKMNKPSTSSSP